jgi:hypothetical protein
MPFGSKTAVLRVARSDVDAEEDVPTFDLPQEGNVASSSWTVEHTGDKLYRVEGELWRNEWVDPAASSPLVRGDKRPSTVSFIVDAEGRREEASTLLHGRRWLWFRPDVMPTLAHRRGGSLGWYTRDTGGVECSPGYDVHFGVNRLGLVNVFAKDIALLPDWQQRIWAGYNIPPDGKVSEELLDSQMRCEPANTQAPERFLGPALAKIKEVSHSELGVSILRDHEDMATILRRTHRFRATDSAGLYALAKDLARLTADAFDAVAIQRVIAPPLGTRWRSLKSVENLLASQIGPDNAAKIMSPLFGVYDLRLADAHLPSSEANEALKRVGVDTSLPLVMQGEQMLRECVDTLYAITNVLRTWNEPPRARARDS